ncbi:MAG TPA: integrin alpha [Flavobacteriales bacterium]|nr:integrin alpha [Flavobacteriales bacterium]HMR27269.1 integrin alpha [Flavobacteriales bacterium]
MRLSRSIMAAVLSAVGLTGPAADLQHAHGLTRKGLRSIWASELADHGMSGRVRAAGFSLAAADGSWQQSLQVRSIGRTDSTRPWRPSAVRDHDGDLRWQQGTLTVQYTGSQEGLRQNFLLAARPAGNGPLVVDLGTNGDLIPVAVDGGEVQFLDHRGVHRLSYRDLRCWDARGVELPAKLAVDHAAGARITITVEDVLAEYPITIDPVSSSPALVLSSPVTGADYGTAVATAGDLNGDGYSDLVIGAPLANNGQTNEGVVYVHYGSNTGIVAAPSVVLEVDQQGAQFGCSASTAGDVNGDGFSDLIVGARSWEDDVVNQLTEGAAFVYYGSAGGVSTVPDVTLQTNQASDNFGANVACLGDINNDGYSDVGVGAYLSAYPSFQEGTVFVFLGGAAGLNTAPTHRLERNQGGAHFGRSLACAGDINGDGYSDVIIGASQWSVSPGYDQGAAFIYHGGPNALGAAFNPAPVLTLFGTPTVNDNNFGWSVACAGDVNGDGYSDVAIGAYRDQIGVQTGEGVVRVFHGSASGLSTTAAIALESNQNNAWMGRWVSTAGDVNGDGYGDLLVGIPYFANPQSQEGQVRLYFGSAAGITTPAIFNYELNTPGAFMGECVSTAGDLNGDGFSDFVVGAFKYGFGGGAAVYMGGPYSMRLAPTTTGTGGAAGASMGAAVGNAGDVNGDGYADALVGIPDGSNGQAGEGLVELRLGGPAGLPGAPTATLEANVGGARFGASVCTAGDVNGDGYADVIVGAPLSGGVGRAYIHHGGPGGLGAAPSTTLIGTAGSEFGFSVSAAGDINTDGYADVLVGAPGTSQTYVYLGAPTGIPTAPHVVLSEPPAANRFGHSVCTAGDVNGDGFSDIIIGARDLGNGQAGEGAAFVHHGSATGVVLPFARRLEVDQAGARFGVSVAGGGDINGDGYFDVVVGADRWESGQTDEGAAFVFHGSAGGIGAVPNTTLQRNIANGFMGASVAEAGDINGNGYADIVVGSPRYESALAQADEGAVYVYQGTPAGINPALIDIIESNVAGEQFGSAVSGGGDADGDGYSEIIAGAPFASPAFANEGRWQWHRGNRGYSLDRYSRQYMADLVSPLATNCMDFGVPDFFGIGHRARSPMHRTDGRLHWEVVFEGQPFSGAPITNSLVSTGQSAGWTDMGVGGTEIKELIYKTAGYLRYKWRVRVEYEPAKLFDGQRFSRWFYGYASGMGDIGVLPVELVHFSGWPEERSNQLVWSTATEHATARFLIERGPDPDELAPIGSVAAVGESQDLVEYAFTDIEPPAGLSYYRLVVEDLDGSLSTGPVITIDRQRIAQTMVVAPKPATDLLHVTWTTSAAWLELCDAAGRPVLKRKIPAEKRTEELHIGALPLGVYVLTLHDPSGAVIDRTTIVKE